LLGFGGKSIWESLGFGLHAAGNLAGFRGQLAGNSSNFGGHAIRDSAGFGGHGIVNLAGFGGQSDSNWGSQVNIGQAVRVPKSDGKDNVGGNLDSGNDAGYNLGDA
jgi:hypothetical protein